MNMKRVIMVLLASAILMGVYAQGQNEGKPAQSVEPTGPVKLQVWYALSGASGQTFVGQAQAFAKEHPEIELELTYSGSYADTATKVSAALLSGTAPDVAVMAAAQLYTGGQGNFEMESLVKDKDFDINDIYPGMAGTFITALGYGVLKTAGDSILAITPAGDSRTTIYALAFMDKTRYQTLTSLIGHKMNVILQGAPGVGKTWVAKRLAYSMMGVKDQSRVMATVSRPARNALTTDSLPS